MRITYFVRYFNDLQTSPQEDLKRGFSYDSLVYNTKESAIEDLTEVTGGSFDEEDIIHSEFGWVTRLKGLRGYECDSIETAEQFIKDNKRKLLSFDNYNYAVIYTGTYMGDDGYGFDLFRPESIVKVVEKPLVL